MKHCKITSFTVRVLAFFTLSLVFTAAAFQQTARAQVSGADRANALGMLDTLRGNLKNNYYDPSYHGVDLDFVYEQAKERMKTAATRDELMMTLAQITLAFNDRHTIFVPPPRSADVEYGWRVSVVGKDCFVTGIKPKSDAEAKGLKVGDKVLSINNVKLTRENLWQMYYRYYLLSPTGMVRFVVLSPNDAAPHTLDVQTKISKTANAVSIEGIINRIIRKGWDEEIDRYVEVGGKDLFIWRMTSFDADDAHIDDMMKRAKAAKSFILDLRGNGGGEVSILKRLIGYFTDGELKIADEKKKKETKSVLAKPRGGGAYKGNLIVLVDNDSGSASEVFARVVQLNHFGKVIGDKTAGAVMEAEYFPMEIGVGSTIYYGANITVADVIMTDGTSLEKVGVTPDEIVLTTGKDLAEKKDPVLSYAAKLLGADITPEKAGTFFPVIWDK